MLLSLPLLTTHHNQILSHLQKLAQIERSGSISECDSDPRKRF